MTVSASKPKSSPGRRYRGQSVARRREERRQRLLLAGREVFGSVGFHATTVRMLCKAAGLTERYFYESFESREAIFEAVLEAASSELQGCILRAAATLPPDADAYGLARAALSEYYRVMLAEPGLARLLLFEALGVNAHIQRRYYEGFEEFSQLFLTLVAPLASRGDFRLERPEYIAAGLIGAAHQIATHWVLKGYRDPLDDVVESALSIFSAMATQVQKT